MKTVTREDTIELRKNFDKYTETAEQHEFAEKIAPLVAAHSGQWTSSKYS